MFGIFKDTWKKESMLETTRQETAVVSKGELNHRDIKRHKPEVPSGDFDEILEEAKESLGYSPTAAGIRKLERVLHDLEIDILDTAQVRAYMDSKTTSTHWFCWYRINAYKLPIPLHVLNKAIQITKKLPEAVFSVISYEPRDAQLGAGQGEVRGYGDPFLFVSVGNRGWHIEVWDEPEFEGRESE